MRGNKKRHLKEIDLYGQDVLRSEVFQKAFTQEHHFCTSVGAHTMNVANASIRICHALQKLHIRTDVRRVTLGALCHDLGILGRKEKYENKRQCCFDHPADSVTVAKHILPDLDDQTALIIRSHMWPLSRCAPKSREAVIVSCADKYAAVKDVLTGLHLSNILIP